MDWKEEFVTDYEHLEFASFTSKYFEKIPQGTTILSLVDYLKNKNALQTFVDPMWFGDTRDQNTYYLLARSDGKFEVFLSERGGKHWLRVYDSLEQAVSHKMDLLLNSLMFAAPDSTVG